MKDYKLRSSYTNIKNVKWDDTHLQVEEKRLDTWDKKGAKYARMKELESQGEYFGNSANTGKWSEEWKQDILNRPSFLYFNFF